MVFGALENHASRPRTAGGQTIARGQGGHHHRGAVNVRKYIFITIIKLNWRLQMALWVACYRSGSASLHFTSWRGQIVPIDPRKDQTVRCFNILPSLVQYRFGASNTGQRIKRRVETSIDPHCIGGCYWVPSGSVNAGRRIILFLYHAARARLLRAR